MEWRSRRQSGNIEDARGRSGSGMPGLRIRGPVAGGGLVVLVLVSLAFGIDPTPLLKTILVQSGAPSSYTSTQGTSTQGGASVNQSAEEADLKQFVAVVLADTEDVWKAQFRAMGKEYQEPRLVLFRNRVASACGLASSAMGPFYCPSDEKVYLDLEFFNELRQKYGAAGDFAQAYVIAHEIGHHVQNQLGISDQVMKARRRTGEEEGNKLSVRLELQADFLAGVWAHHAERSKQILDPGDLEEALKAASAIGDDKLQKRAQGYVVPESFTHGTSAQREQWFRRGFETGDIERGDTFAEIR